MLTAFLRMMAWLAARVPRRAALAAGRGLGWLTGSVIRVRRREVLESVRRSLPERNPAEAGRIVARMYRNLGANMAEVLRLAGGRTEDLDPRVRFEGEERVQEALARGRGVLILTAHVGNWDLLAMLTARSRYRLTVISKSLRNAALNDMWMRIRRHFGVAILPAHQSYRMCLRVLRRNELLGFILDQNRPREEGIFVDFFGRPACTSPGLAFMSAQSGAPVVPAFILREGEERHVVRVLPLIEPPPDREAETIRRATQHYTKIIEDVVREHPDQWLWLHRRWKTQPERQVPCRNGWPGGQPRGIGADIEQGEVRS